MGKIYYTKGDVVEALLNGEVDYLIHCCNCQNNFGSGIAKQIKEQIPEAYTADCGAAKEGRNVLGNFSMDGGVINVYGQEFYGYVGEYFKNYGRQGNYGAIAKAFENVNLMLWSSDPDNTIKVGIPYLFASDRAGCDWQIIQELIEYVLCRDNIDVYIYKLEG